MEQHKGKKCRIFVPRLLRSVIRVVQYDSYRDTYFMEHKNQRWIVEPDPYAPTTLRARPFSTGHAI